jgi:type II secretory pathway component PulF
MVTAGAAAFVTGFVCGVTVVAAGSWLFALEIGRVAARGHAIRAYMTSLLWRLPLVGALFLAAAWVLSVNTLGLVLGSAVALFGASLVAITKIRSVGEHAARSQ